MENKQKIIERYNTLEFMQEVASLHQSIETQQAIVGGAQFDCGKSIFFITTRPSRQDPEEENFKE